jgi:hypothetical protein
MENKNKDKAAATSSVSVSIKNKKNCKKTNLISINGNKVLQGIIFSEILGKPKGRRGR